MTHLLFHTDDPQLMLQFYQDIVSSSIFNNAPSFLQKYPHTILTNYSTVPYLQQFTKTIVKQIVINNAQKLNELKPIISAQLQNIMGSDSNELTEEQLTQIVNAMSQALFARLQEIKTVYLLETISLGSLYLQDLNWKITKTISSSAKSFIGIKNPYLFTLTLYLKKSSQVNNNHRQNLTKPVTLQMSKVQLKQFLTQLKAIKQQINS